MTTGGACLSRARAGFTLFEAVMVLIIVATVVGALTPSVARTLSRARVNRAANVVAADLMMAQSLAGRQRAPVRASFDAGGLVGVLWTQSGTMLQLRAFGSGSDYRLSTLSASPNSILILPSGMASGSITVTLTAYAYTRTVTMSRAGQVRVN